MTTVVKLVVSAPADKGLNVRQYSGFKGDQKTQDTVYRDSETAELTLYEGVMYQFDEVNAPVLQVEKVDPFYGELEDGTVMFDPATLVSDEEAEASVGDVVPTTTDEVSSDVVPVTPTVPSIPDVIEDDGTVTGPDLPGIPVVEEPKAYVHEGPAPEARFEEAVETVVEGVEAEIGEALAEIASDVPEADIDDELDKILP